ncbi:MAG TPA: redoxin domain-containing protein [Limnochordales bacterium]
MAKLPRWAALAIVGLVAAGLIVWEVTGLRRTDPPQREVAVILGAQGPFPETLYLEEGAQYRIALTSLDEAYPLPDGPGIRTQAAGREVVPGGVAWIELTAGADWDGRRLGESGPVVRVVDSLSRFVAMGEVYPVAIIAGEGQLIPEQVRLLEGSRILLGGTSLSRPRVVTPRGTAVPLALFPGQVLQIPLEVPTPGTYPLECEQGCEQVRWRGAFRVEALDSEVPWVEAAGSDAAAELGRMAPDFALYDVNGRVVQLSEFRGDKGVFVNFWATWCPPCLREMPAMQALFERRGHEVAILAVNYRETRDQVQGFMADLGLQFPALLDVQGDVAHRYNVWSYPTSVFIDRDGVVRGRFVGELSPELMEAFVDAITGDPGALPIIDPEGPAGS